MFHKTSINFGIGVGTGMAAAAVSSIWMTLIVILCGVSLTVLLEPFGKDG